MCESRRNDAEEAFPAGFKGVWVAAALALAAAAAPLGARAEARIPSYRVPAGGHAYDVAPDPDGGGVWTTTQHQGRRAGSTR